MANMIKKVEYGVRKTILIAPELAFAIPVQIGNEGVQPNANGRKIIKAGTPIGGDVSVFTARETVLKSTNTVGDGAKSQGVLLHDVDVTDGAENGTMLVDGYVDINKIDVTVEEAAKTALTRILFMKGL